jgi:hypothetical protein
LPQRTGHGHGSGDDRKKNLSLHPVLEDGSPVKSALAVPLTKKQYQPLSLDAARGKKCRNTASDGRTPAWWQSTTKPARMRHPLGAIWPGARPKWVSASEKKGCRGTRIPVFSACAYTHTAPGGGGEQARRSLAGRAV